jgi:hypothetical protein
MVLTTLLLRTNIVIRKDIHVEKMQVGCTLIGWLHPHWYFRMSASGCEHSGGHLSPRNEDCTIPGPTRSRNGTFVFVMEFHRNASRQRKDG